MLGCGVWDLVQVVSLPTPQKDPRGLTLGGGAMFLTQ